MLFIPRLIPALRSADPRWKDALVPFEADADTILAEPDAVPKDAFFLTQGIVSLRTEWLGREEPGVRQADADDEDGEIAVVMVGPEGIVGSEALLIGEPLPFRPVAETRIRGLRVSTETGRDILYDSPMSRAIIDRYHRARNQEQAFHQAAAVRLRRPARTALWLAKVSEFLDKEVMSITQKRLADMTGERRPSITEDIGKLRRQGVVRTPRHGRIEVLDEDRLIEMAGPALVSFKRNRADLAMWLARQNRGQGNEIAEYAELRG